MFAGTRGRILVAKKRQRVEQELSLPVQLQRFTRSLTDIEIDRAQGKLSAEQISAIGAAFDGVLEDQRFRRLDAYRVCYWVDVLEGLREYV